MRFQIYNVLIMLNIAQVICQRKYVLNCSWQNTLLDSTTTLQCERLTTTCWTKQDHCCTSSFKKFFYHRCNLRLVEFILLLYFIHDGVKLKHICVKSIFLTVSPIKSILASLKSYRKLATSFVSCS